MNWRRAADLASIVVVFTVVGPIVGLLVTAAAGGIAAASDGDLGGGFNVAAFLLLYGVLFAHLIGVIPAAITGLLVAGWAFFRGRVPLLAGVIAGLCAAIVVGYLRPLNLVGRLAEVELRTAVLTGIMALAHMVAALACTRLTRRWQ